MGKGGDKMSKNETKIGHPNIIEYAILNIYNKKIKGTRIKSDEDKAKISRLLYLLLNIHNTKEIQEPLNRFINTTLGIRQTPISEGQLNINIPHVYAVAISTLYIVSKR